MLKLLIVLLVVRYQDFTFSKEYPILRNYECNVLVVQEKAILIAAAKVPSPAIIDREQGKKNFILFTAPKTEDPIGRIDQWEFGGLWGPASSIPG